MRLRYYFQFRELIYEKMSFRAHIIPLKANISLFAAPAGMRRRTAAPHLPAARPDVALRRRMLSRMRCFAAAPERVILRLRKYKGTGASERAEFYCEINIFFCEWTDRLLRDKFFYLRVEFSLVPRGFSYVRKAFSYVGKVCCRKYICVPPRCENLPPRCENLPPRCECLPSQYICVLRRYISFPPRGILRPSIPRRRKQKGVLLPSESYSSTFRSLRYCLRSFMRRAVSRSVPLTP